MFLFKDLTLSKAKLFLHRLGEEKKKLKKDKKRERDKLPKEGVSFSEEIQIYPRKPFIPESGKGEHSMKQPQRKILPHLATCTQYR